jgi:hypothetical protein
MQSFHRETNFLRNRGKMTEWVRSERLKHVTSLIIFSWSVVSADVEMKQQKNRKVSEQVEKAKKSKPESSVNLPLHEFKDGYSLNTALSNTNPDALRLCRSTVLVPGRL